MPKNVKGWLEEVIKYNSIRPAIRMSRSRGFHSLRDKIEEIYSRGRIAIIAEFKTKSPSGLNVIRDPIDYVKLVEKRAVGISVLTEELYFGGSYNNLISIASITDLPILMKDIVVSYNQVETAYNIGADAILLIASILTDRELDMLYETARSFKLEALIEVHDEDEAEHVISMGFPMVGVNSRNLATLEIDLSKAYKVLEKIPNTATKVAESGIKNRKDIEYLKRAGAKAFLIGTELMLNPSKIYELTD
ncbi:MAG: indole-3-glycerol phosphate synthase TrpC [Acidilobaceae archaeon]